MNILLTGATGFIGSRIRAQLAARHRVFALARSPQPKDQDHLTWLTADLKDREAFRQFPDQIDAVIHLAKSKAHLEFPDAAQDIFDVNVGATLMLLEYARQRGATRFIFASSANVYKPSPDFITEATMPEPLTFYARSKRMAEMIVESYGSFLNCSVLRLFTVYGPGQTGRLIPTLIQKLQQDEPILVQGEQGLRITPIFVDDVCAVIQTVLEADSSSPGFEVFNVAGAEHFNLPQLGHKIGEAFNLPVKLEHVGGDEPGGWVTESVKLKERFPLGQFVSFEKGLERIIYACSK